MTLKIKMTLLVAISLVGITGLAGFSQYEMNKVYEKANFANENSVPALIALNEAIGSAAVMRVQLWQHMATKDVNKKAELEGKMLIARKKVDDALIKYEPTIVDEKDRAMLAADRAALLEYDGLKEKVLVLSKAFKTDEATEFRLANQKVFGNIIEAFRIHNEYNVALATQGANEAIVTKKTTVLFSFFISFLTFGIIAYIGLFITRSIMIQLGGEPTLVVMVANKIAIGDFSSNIELKQGDSSSMMAAMKGLSDKIQSYIAETTEVLASMVEGKMDVEIIGDYKGDFIKLKISINKIIDSFNQILNEIRNSASEILLSSRQLSDSSLSLSQGSSEQASSTEEITSALTQIEAQAKQNTETAMLTDETAKKVNANAITGNSEMVGLLKAMDELSTSSEKISKIIKEIESIAFQTNILALNAAVEAARAGQHGKGFNVVSTEVRNLAMRCTSSAKESAIMVEETIKRIMTSSKMAQNTSNSLNTIVEGISKVSDLLGDIAQSSKEQTMGISQVNTGINDIAKVTMSNSAGSEEIAAASEELSGKAESFKAIISNFKIKGIQESNTLTGMKEKPKHKVVL